MSDDQVEELESDDEYSDFEDQLMYVFTQQGGAEADQAQGEEKEESDDEERTTNPQTNASKASNLVKNVIQQGVKLGKKGINTTKKIAKKITKKGLNEVDIMIRTQGFLSSELIKFM